MGVSSWIEIFMVRWLFVMYRSIMTSIIFHLRLRYSLTHFMYRLMLFLLRAISHLMYWHLFLDRRLTVPRILLKVSRARVSPQTARIGPKFLGRESGLYGFFGFFDFAESSTSAHLPIRSPICDASSARLQKPGHWGIRICAFLNGLPKPGLSHFIVSVTRVIQFIISLWIVQWRQVTSVHQTSSLHGLSIRLRVLFSHIRVLVQFLASNHYLIECVLSKHHWFICVHHWMRLLLIFIRWYRSDVALCVCRLVFYFDNWAIGDTWNVLMHRLARGCYLRHQFLLLRGTWLLWILCWL